MSTTTAPMTVAEFLKLPDEVSDRYELSEGRLVERDGPGGIMANWRHEMVKSNLTRILNRFLEPGTAKVFPEALFKLTPEVARKPDLAVRRSDRPPPSNPDAPFSGAPELAIEVVSSETADELETKIQQYFGAGAKAVWAVFPDRGIVRRYVPPGTSQIFREGEVLEDPEVLPGFRVKLAEIFEGVQVSSRKRPSRSKR